MTVKSLSIALAFSVLPIISSTAHAAFQFTSTSAVVNESSWDITFTTTFNQSPNFTNVDAFGRLENSFQFYIFSGSNTTSYADLVTLVRGSEIDLVNNLIPVRAKDGGGAFEPGSGGWGPVIGYLPFTWNEASNTLSFTAPDWLLNSATPYFKYQLETYNYGLTTNTGYFTTAVPEPTSLALLIGGLGILGLRRKFA